MSPRPLSRRDFLHRLGLGGAAVVAGGYGLSVWEWAGPASASAPGSVMLGDGAKGRTLVIVEMAGGNDGLNTVVPLNVGAYHDLRPTLGVTDPLPLDADIGLHPNLAKLAKRFEQGQVAIVEGLGYPEPDLSHFGSIAIWWSARGGSGQAGWLGAYLDGTVGFDDPLAAIGIGPGPSPALLGTQSFATTIADASGLQPRLPAWLDRPDDLLQAWGNVAPAKVDAATLVGQVQRSVGLTVSAREDLAKSLTSGADEPANDDTSAAGRRAYQATSVVDSLALAAELIRSPAKPRVIYVSGIGDFDTHQAEAQTHPELMSQLDEGIDSFFTALGEAANDVVLATVSEFGRRPAENGSGTDHGTANVHFVVGPAVKGGRFGEPPSLTNLDPTGNLVHTEDFRSLYATLLDGWLGVEPGAVLGDDFPTFPLFTDGGAATPD
jgi:uncharacterized protein (DUF1501 family)